MSQPVTKAQRNKKITPPAGQWQLQTAKAQFSELFRRARTVGPQVVTRQGKDAVVILPLEDFERLTTGATHPKSLVKFFAESPLAKASIDLERRPDYGRKIKF